jgi:hypothetical protein
MKKLPLLVALAVGLLSGCTSANQLVRELAHDNATVDLHVKSVWGSVDFTRSNPAPPVIVTNAANIKTP